MKNLYSLFLVMSLTLLSFVDAFSQCTNCDFSAPADGTNFNFNGNQTLCITGDASGLNWNMNGTNNKICVATGVTWTQPFGGVLGGGVVVDVYGTLDLGGSLNVNGTATINVKPGGVVNYSGGGFGNGLTINNEGDFNFTNSGVISTNGNTFVFNNLAGATLDAPNTTNFFMGNGSTWNNFGTMNFANLENEEGYLNNNTGATLEVKRSFNNHGAFINVGSFELPCETLPGAAGATTCSFRVGDKGAGKEFVTSGCFCVTGDVRFDGVGTINGPFIITDGDLNINKNVSGTNGTIKVLNGVSTLALNTTFSGTNLKFCDVNTAGNGFDVLNTGASTNATISCAPLACACDGGTVACVKPALTLNQTAPTCTGATANNDGKITLVSATNATNYGVSSGSTYTGAAYPATAYMANADVQTAIPNAGGTYTLRVFNGSADCFKDTTITVAPVVCSVTACSVSLTATPGTCAPATNTYDVTGTLTFANAPATGTLTVSDGTITQVFNAPFTSPQGVVATCK